MAAGGGQAAFSFLTNIARTAVGLGVSASLLSASLYTVDGGQRAVLFDRFRGVLDETVGEGTHFLVPWLQKPYIFDIRTRPHTFTSNSGTKDLQMVNLTLRLLSRPDVPMLPTIFKSLGTEYDEKVLPSIGNEVLKAVVAQFNADQLLTERPHVSALVRDALIRRARDFNIVLDDVAITHLSYGSEFSIAVEKKQVAQQEAERSKFLVARAEQERRAAVIRAEGESEAAKLISDATAAVGTGILELRRIEAAREIASTLSKSPNVVYLPGGNNMLLGLNPTGLGQVCTHNLFSEDFLRGPVSMVDWLEIENKRQDGRTRLYLGSVSRLGDEVVGEELTLRSVEVSSCQVLISLGKYKEMVGKGGRPRRRKRGGEGDFGQGRGLGNSALCYDYFTVVLAYAS
ncbi:hypothetical protein M5K25_008668 [Dendrobium thyrsiflorum]|uniref:Band 7 domain-containing protein n=1 Tax=Dendrobium thyrsiflorum TaxID=117978 RepID=A0ABD0VG41_DENTH